MHLLQKMSGISKYILNASFRVCITPHIIIVFSLFTRECHVEYARRKGNLLLIEFKVNYADTTRSISTEMCTSKVSRTPLFGLYYWLRAITVFLCN